MTETASPLTVVHHSVVQHCLSQLRHKDTGIAKVRELVHRLSQLLVMHATESLPMQAIDIETPVATAHCHQLTAIPVFCPILRAGLGMLDGALSLIPDATVGYLGYFRDETTHLPNQYYCKLPPIHPQQTLIVIDPMLATGGTAVAAINALKMLHDNPIVFVCLVAAPEGINALHNAHPEVHIVTGSIDDSLNDDAFIVPGLGDAGDRLYG